MADKLSYRLIMMQICVFMGWIDQAGRDTEFRDERDMLEVRSGRGPGIVLRTRNSDIHAAWDPMDGDKQLRARDALLASLKQMRLQPGSLCHVSPDMWATQ